MPVNTFSRADASSKIRFNIHQGINNTLIILKHRLKATPNRPEIKMITEYGCIPEIEGYPGQLNQVFINLIANAIDALEEESVLTPMITMSTKLINDEPLLNSDSCLLNVPYVVISIQDNGRRMSEEVKQRMFDYLLTTKPVGKGTGLGLSISRQIVEEKHGGRLKSSSTLGKGTEFVVAIPIG